MPFPDDVVLSAWRLSSARCQCEHRTHAHTGRCPQTLRYELRGSAEPGGWDAYRIRGVGPDTLDNCELLCVACRGMAKSRQPVAS